LAVTNTGGTLNSQVFRENVGLNRPGALDYGIYRATYGTVADGFDVDMMLNLETKEKQAAFENDYATRMHSLRTNVASLSKNFFIHGQYGVLHQIRASIGAPSIGTPGDGIYNPQPNVMVAPVQGVPFTIKVPIDVFQSNFKRGRMIIKTRSTGTDGYVAPWAPADVSELYMILDNQPNLLSLLPCGTTFTAWQDGDFLQIQGNREVVGGGDPFRTSWSFGMLTVPSGPFQGTYDLFTGTGSYTYYRQDGTPGAGSPAGAVVGAMEGLADLFPWYMDPAAMGTRLGINLPFRDQANRLLYSTEQAGGFVMQQAGENIIDAIMRGAFLTKATVPYAEIGVWINPVTRIQMGYEEGDNVRVLRDNFVQGPIVWQRGTKTTDYQIGTQVVREVVEDLNMPTDVIIIGPKDDMSYNCWDNTTFQIDEYIQELWAKSPPKKVEDIAIPDELMTKMDITNRVIFGTPSMNDGKLGSFNYGNNIRHPKNSMPVALQEMGALFTEYPYTYTVVKLLEPITDIATV